MAQAALTFPVVERFVSINGEGACAGVPAAFIRFAGCNLACSYCDTLWASEPEAAMEIMDVDSIVDYVAETGVPCVTLTGGEPVLQQGLVQLVDALLTRTDARVEIETNGAVDLSAFKSIENDRLSLTVDYKLPGSGMESRMIAENYRGLRPWDSVKFVVGSLEDLECMEKVAAEYGLPGSCQVFVSPVWGSIEPSQIVDFILQRKLFWARVQLQLHKIVWPGTERGV